ncbi:glycosyltransferase [Endozoicomonas atrinae]|uniref:glycosyltransferase n=1 Tax=Endozoicomonas atrinae TaxID=1333660 RepID=UPI003AFFD683
MILKGFSSKKDKIYSRKDILVMPSLSEGFPFVMLEAASYGVPIIATDVGGISDFVEHGVNGYLVSANNFNQINDYIFNLAINSHERKKMGLQARMKLERSFTKEKMIDSTIKNGVVQT